MIINTGFPKKYFRQCHNVNNQVDSQNAQRLPSFGSITIKNTTTERLYPLKKFFLKLFPSKYYVSFLMQNDSPCNVEFDTFMNEKTIKPLDMIITSKSLSPLYKGEIGSIFQGMSNFVEGFKEEAVIAQVLKGNNKDLDIVTDHEKLRGYLSSLFN